MPAGVKTDALANQCYVFLRTPRGVTQVDDRCITDITALRDGAKRAGAHLLQLFIIVFPALPAVRLRKRANALAVNPRRELVRRQCGKFPAQHITFGPRARNSEFSSIA